MLNNEVVDPFEAANNATEPVYVRNFFGQCWFDVYFCALVKGQGKVAFDPAIHKQKFTAINLSIQPLAGSSAKFPIERQLIAESKEWASIILPSIKALGKTPKELHGSFVQVEIVPTGEKYTAKDGTVKEKSTPKFVAVFPDEASCQRVNDAHFGNPANNTEPTSAPNGNAEREVALKFLPALATQAGKDPLKLSELIASNGLVSKYFNINSPEVIAVLS